MLLQEVCLGRSAVSSLSYRELNKKEKTPDEIEVVVFEGCLVCRGRMLAKRALEGSMRCTSFYCKEEYKFIKVCECAWVGECTPMCEAGYTQPT